MNQDARPELERGGFYGAVLGCSLWMLLGAGFLFSRSAPLAAGWLVAFAATLGWAAWVWRRRAQWKRTALLFRLIGGVAVITVMLFAATLAAGHGDFLRLTDHDGHSGWLTLLVFPFVALVLWRVHRDR